ncbi:hypothetical protein M3Y99_00896100 [Aphelenchoides fujianensis]|nr:hypothetical protein M3Y99_00896100 [Aphelenchoides fujianensis]
MHVGRLAAASARFGRNVRILRLRHQPPAAPPATALLLSDADRLSDEIEQLATITNTQPLPDEDLQFALFQRYKRDLDLLEQEAINFKTSRSARGSLPRFAPSADRIRNSMPALLEEALEQQDLGAIRFYLSRYHWPPSRRFQSLINDVFDAFLAEIELTTGAETKKLVEEIQELFWDLSENERLATLPPNIVLGFAARLHAEAGLQASVEFLERFDEKFAIKSVVLSQPGDRAYATEMCRQMLTDALVAVERDAEGRAKMRRLSEIFVRSGFLRNSDALLEATVHHRLEKGDWANALSFWTANASTSYSIAGVDLLLEWVLRDRENFAQTRESRIKEVIKVVERIKSPSTALAECTSALLATGGFEDARILARHSVIHPADFVRPVKRFLEKENLEAVESFAHLLVDVYFAEMKAKRKGGRRATAGEEDELEVPAEELELDAEEVEQKMNVYGNVAFLIARTYRRRKRYTPKKPKVKKYEVNLRQLDFLVHALFDTWIGLADLHQNTTTLDKMRLFVALNEINVRPQTADRLASLYERLGINSPPVGAESVE